MKQQIKAYGQKIRDYAKNNYRLCFRDADGLLKHPFIVPGSCYKNSLWDWDFWLTDLALRKIADSAAIGEFEKGCVLNFLDHVDEDGRMPIYIKPNRTSQDAFTVGKEKNIHKPCLAQHALFVAEENGEIEWFRNGYECIERYLGWYDRFCYHESGLYVWLDDFAIGVDNDP